MVSLYLDHNSIQDEDTQYLADMLRNNKILIYLCFASNENSDLVVISLAIG